MPAAELARQRALLEALHSGVHSSGLSAGTPGVARGLQALRDNAAGVAARALGTVYGEIEDELGEESFASLAFALWRAHPPVEGDLAQWGGELPGFLAARPAVPARLVELAVRLWARHQVERAPDAVFDGASLALLAEAPTGLRLRMSPGLRVLELGAEPWVIWRRGWRAAEAPLSDAEAFLMRALGAQDLHHALEQALVAHPDFDFSNWLTRAIEQAWLQGAYVETSNAIDQ